ncbi:hypothetical protein DCCM_3870 [Desulfocucumis palustris]|uniref:Uncharacterized protein n=1 Tax=Desulfocucumis palustris TaxID=1898651 RepID=A0A2L2XF20_9FIRM|nr:hypothetical protein DCCM_3870 [Desulfocucumis palustris]
MHITCVVQNPRSTVRVILPVARTYWHKKFRADVIRCAAAS